MFKNLLTIPGIPTTENEMEVGNIHLNGETTLNYTGPKAPFKNLDTE